MWLLSVDSYELREFTASEGIPPYAILSHRWYPGKDSEVTFRDIFKFNRGFKHQQQNRMNRCGPQATEKAAWPKVEMCCKVAKQEGLEWVWIDTCCINKSSSAALAEAINSMFGWYRDAAKCIVFLRDVGSRILSDGTFPEDEFRSDSWFTRGWTLQELIAPTEVLFFARDWTPLGTKATLTDIIVDITNIDRSVLMHQDLQSVSVAKIMSWAAKRETKLIEDRAYSLAGLFGVTITPVYGEGEASFKRLQIEIMKVSNDQSLFAWSLPAGECLPADLEGSFLAPSPDYFRHSSRVVSVKYEDYREQYHFTGPIEDYSMTNQGLRIHLPIFVQSTHRCLIDGALHAVDSFKQHHYHEAEEVLLESVPDVHLPSAGAWAKHKFIYACLACRFEDGDKSFVSIALTREPSGQYKRLDLKGGMSSLRATSHHKSHYYGTHMGTIYVWEDQQTLQDLLRKRSTSVDSAYSSSLSSFISKGESSPPFSRTEVAQSPTSTTFSRTTSVRSSASPTVSRTESATSLTFSRAASVMGTSSPTISRTESAQSPRSPNDSMGRDQTANVAPVVPQQSTPSLTDVTITDGDLESVVVSLSNIIFTATASA